MLSQFVRYARRSLVVACLSGAGLAAAVSAARAQGPLAAHDARVPRFLLVTAAGAQPVPLDVAHTPVLHRRISLDLQDVGTDAAVRAIANAAALTLVFTRDALPPRPVTLRAQDITLAAALTEVLLGAEVDVVFRPDGSAALVPRRQAGIALPQGRVISGVVTDSTGGKPLADVNVLLKGTKTGTVTKQDGSYRLQVPVSSGTLSFYRIGYRPVDRPFDNTVSTLNVALPHVAATLSAVEVMATRRSLQPVAHTSDEQVVEEIRTSTSVVSGISSEQIGKSADLNAAQVVKRISGVTVTDESFLVVRGMSERYNATYLGDNLAPSTEQYSRAFAMNLLPSRIIDRILVYKSPRADLLGDFAGAAVKVYTKDALAVQHFDVGVRLGYLPLSTGKSVLTYDGGRRDWLGVDDGSRALPSVLPAIGDFRQAKLAPAQYVSAFNPALTYGTRNARPDLQLTANYYDVFTPFREKALYNVTSASYTSETRYNDDIYRQQGNTLLGGNYNLVNSLSHESRSIETAQLNLLQNFTLKVSDAHSLYWKNFLLNDGRKSTQVRISRPNNGVPADGSVGNGIPFGKRDILAFSQRMLWASNFGGNHAFANSTQSLGWNLGYTGTRYEMPDQRVINLTAWSPMQGDTTWRWIAAVRNGDESSRQRGIISRMFLDNREALYNGSADYVWSPATSVDLKLGTYHFWKERRVGRRVYLVHDALFTTINDVYANAPPTGSPYLNSGAVWFREQDLGKVWSSAFIRSDSAGLAVFDVTLPSDAYRASENYNAGYLSVVGRPWGGKVEVDAGVRVEHDRQQLAATVDQFYINTPILVDRPLTSVLPSVNASLRLTPAWVVRAGYGRTVNRPEFREIAPFTDYDYLQNEMIVGNPQLQSATIDNVDLRVELYPQNGRGEAFSLGAFYKQLKRPIERIVSTSVVGEFTLPVISYMNGDQAIVKGLEGEARASLAFVPGPLFRQLSVVANGAWIRSEASKDTILPAGYVSSPNFRRPLQGQAPYVVNLGLFYDRRESGTKASLTYNVSGTSIYSVGRYEYNPHAGGSGTRGSVLQLPRHLLDAAFTQSFATRWQVKLSAQNLLDEDIRFAEDNNFDNRYDPEVLVPATATMPAHYEGDNIWQRYKPGRSILLTTVYSF